MSRGSLVRLVTKLNAGRPRNRGSILGRDKKVFSSLTRPDRHRGLPTQFTSRWAKRVFSQG